MSIRMMKSLQRDRCVPLTVQGAIDRPTAAGAETMLDGKAFRTFKIGARVGWLSGREANLGRQTVRIHGGVYGGMQKTVSLVLGSEQALHFFPQGHVPHAGRIQ